MNSEFVLRGLRHRPTFATVMGVCLSLFVTSLAACGSLAGPAWSNSAGGQPTLTGEWVGEMPLADDLGAVLYLQLERPPDDDGVNLVGAARYCIGDQQGEFEVWGNADTDGQVDDLHLRPPEDAPLWLLHDVSSRWDGDRLTLVGTYSYDPTRQHIARSDQPEPPLVLELQRSDEATFEGQCSGG